MAYDPWEVYDWYLLESFASQYASVEITEPHMALNICSIAMM